MARQHTQLWSLAPSLMGALMLASGAAALGYQIVWTQQAALWLGHEGAATLAVVGAFFGGLALGAWALGGAVARSTRPARWYAACEAAVALWCGALFFLMAPASSAITALVGMQASAGWQALVTGLGTWLLFLPATLAMGATMPAMECLMAQRRKSGSRIAALYAANTLGGVLGVLGAAFVLVPQWGLLATAGVCSGLNLLCAVLAWLLPTTPMEPATQEAAPSHPQPGTAKRRFWAAVLALTGLLGVAYEVVVLRVLSQVAENTVYTLALLLAVYLMGTALGAALWARRRKHVQGAPREHVVQLLLGLALSCLLCGASLWLMPWFKAALLPLLGLLPVRGQTAALGTEALLAVIAFGLPTVVMGALFSALCEAAAAQGLGFGNALAVNTAGAALAPALWGLGLLVSWGAQAALLALVGGYALLGGLLLAWGPKRRNIKHLASPLAVVVVGAVAVGLAPPLRLLDMPAGGHVVSHQEGALGSVSVTEDPAGVRLLRINNRQQEGSNATALADARQAWLPLLLHPAPQRALFVGLGTGVTTSAAALDPALDVQAVELLPEVVQAARHFRDAVGDAVGQGQGLDRVAVHVADARRFLRHTPQQWDVIVADNFHPARAGSASLYTVEHFRAVQARLAPGGLFCQWLPLHQMDLATLRSIVRGFMAVYPQGRAVLATHSLQTPVLGLIASSITAPTPAAVSVRIASSHMVPGPVRFGLGDPWAVLGSEVAGPATLSRWSAAAPMNTDDHPVVAYLAPRATYEPADTPAERLQTLLADWEDAPPQRADRLAAYRLARTAFLRADMGVRPSADPARMLQQVREPLLAVLHLSPDFEPAYQPLLRMAQALQQRDPAQAEALLQELARVAPAAGGAQRALQELRAQPAPR